MSGPATVVSPIVESILEDSGDQAAEAAEPPTRVRLRSVSPPRIPRATTRIALKTFLEEKPLKVRPGLFQIR